MRWSRCVPTFGAVALAGCAVTPPLREDDIAVSQIVQRVKCEVALAIPEPEPPFPTGRYQWMADWTAKVDLTLITNDQSAITPTAAFINPLPSQVVPLVGSISRNFTFGIGAGLTANALRNETMSFTVSVQELRNKKYRGECALPEGLDLYGNLGLKEWVVAALGPVDREMLTIGKHTAPNAKPASPKQFATDLSHVEQIHQAAVYAEQSAAKASASVRRARDIATKYFADARKEAPLVVRNDMQAVYRQVEDALTQARDATDWSQKAAAAEKLLTDQERKNLTAAQLQEIEDAKAAGKSAGAAKTAADAVWNSIPQDSPIDSLGHQVQFIVVATANATPSWTLVHFKGPGASGNFASLTDTRTHTLNIALGAPAGAVNASPEQERMLNNLKLDTLRIPPN